MINVLTTAWLEDLSKQPSSTVYRLLVPHFKEAYTNERFVFYNAQPVDNRHFDHLLEVLDYIDISRSFCLVITNQQATYNYFKKAGCSVDFDENVTPSAGVADPVDPMYYNSNLCAYAWAGLHVRPSGTVSFCCDSTEVILNDNQEPYNIRTDSIQTIISSNWCNQRREELRHGKTPTNCSKCSMYESSGGESKRGLSPFLLENIHGYVDWEADNVLALPKFFGAHIGNLCNLKCRICSPNCSSQIASEEGISLKEHNWNKSHSTFWDDLLLDQSIVNHDFLGGEPFLLKENLQYMESLIENGRSTECIFNITTNATVFPEFLLEANKFKRLAITLSIDNIEQRFEYERKNAVWNQVKDNIQKFVNLIGPTVEIGTSITISARFKKLVRFLERDAHRVNTVAISGWGLWRILKYVT